MNRTKLLRAVQLAAAVAPARPVKEILRNLLLDTAAVVATDGEIAIRVYAGESVPTLLLPAARLLAVLRESSDEEADIVTKGDSAVIKSGGAKFTIPTQDPAEFPTVAFEQRDTLRVNASELLEALRLTAFACDTASSRYALGGVKFEARPEQGLHLIGTDGRRLAVAEVKNAEPLADLDCIIPERACQVLAKLLADCEGTIEISADLNTATIKHDGFALSCRLVEGRFPAWRKIIPAGDPSTVVKIAAGQVLTAIRQAAVVCDADSRAVDVAIDSLANTLTIEGQTAAIGSSEIVIPDGAIDGKSVKLKVDSLYVTEPLRALPANCVVSIECRGSNAPVEITTPTAGGVYSYVLMPMSNERK
jgi:DNA polymerase-3 subunit beta